MNNKIISIVILFMLTITITGCINNDNNEDNNNDWWENERFHYEIEIDYSMDSNYTLILPVPLISRENNPKKGDPIDLMNELIIMDGTGNYKIGLNEFGYGLEITSTDSIHIFGEIFLENESTDNDDNYAFSDLSMALSDKYDTLHRIYFSGENNSAILNMSIFYKREHSEGGHNLEWGRSNYNVIHNWQEIDIFIENYEIG